MENDQAETGGVIKSIRSLVKETHMSMYDRIQNKIESSKRMTQLNLEKTVKENVGPLNENVESLKKNMEEMKENIDSMKDNMEKNIQTNVDKAIQNSMNVLKDENF